MRSVHILCAIYALKKKKPLISLLSLIQLTSGCSKHFAMKKIKYFFLSILAVCLLLFFSCGKESPSVTVVNGAVVDKYTGAPIEEVSINIHKWQEIDQGYFLFKTITTDSQGKFSFGDEETPDFQIGQFRKTGYLFKQKAMTDLFNNYQKGKTNEGVIQMIPLDGILNLKVENLLGQQDTIYLEIFSPLLKSEIGISGGIVYPPIRILDLLPGQHAVQNIPLASNQDITVYWDVKPIVYSAASQASVSMIRNDTVFYSISY